MGRPAKVLETREVAPGKYAVIDPNSAAEAVRRLQDGVREIGTWVDAGRQVKDTIDGVLDLLKRAPRIAGPAHVEPLPNPDNYDDVPDAER